MKGFILLIIALLLSLVFLPIGFIFQIIVTLFRSINTYLFTIAKSIDQLGNVVCADLFNTTLIKKGGYTFGNEDVTISHVLGMNKKFNNLTFTGKALSWLLNAIDKDHVEKAIEYGKD
jgi:energy-coupling factor transporter transmembrane protein EcfT